VARLGTASFVNGMMPNAVLDGLEALVPPPKLTVKEAEEKAANPEEKPYREVFRDKVLKKLEEKAIEKVKG
jgi:hypothetical protein